MKHNPKKNQLLIEAMEPRLLFSADLDGGLISGGLAGHSALLNPALVDSHMPATAGADDTRAASAIRQELVLVDSDTPDYQQLIDDLLAQQDESRHLEVILLDNTRDGIHQVTEILSNYRGLDAVHLISHGSEGTVDLGGSVLEFESLNANTGLIQSWGEAFSADGDLLIYGCDLAATAGGQGMVDALGRLTGADVAASDDLTGNAALGGDWVLEYDTGRIETELAVSADTRHDWSHVMALETARDEFNTAASYAGNDGTQNWTGDWQELGEVNGPAAGNVRVESSPAALRIGSTGMINGDGALREVDLFQAGSATLSFDAWRSASRAATITIAVSDNGGIDWTDLQTWSFASLTSSPALKTFDISAYASANTQIRFLGAGEADAAHFYADNIQIEYETNAAPVLSGANDLTAIDEDPVSNNGTLVSTLIAGQITDADAGALEGIAVAGVDNSNGTWEYTINGGGTWLAFGTPDTSAARLLAADANTYVRFVPNSNWNGTVTNGLTFHAWDQTGGSNGGTDDLTANTGGSTPFSTATANSDITVNPVNDVPTDASLSNSSVNENTDTTGGYSVGTLTSTDADGGDSHSYVIVGGADMGVFSIGGAGLDELILTDGTLDFETKNSYEVIVRTTDNGSPNLSYDETLTITVNDQTGNISGTIFTDEGVTGIGAGVNISMVINGVLQETVTTDGTGSYSFKKEAGTGDAVAVFIDNDATYQGITVTVSDGTDLGGIQVFANHIVVRNDNGGATSITDMDNALGAYADPDIHYAVVGGNLVANAAGSELLVPAGHTFIPGGDVNATSIKILGTVIGGSDTFNIVENWDSAAGSWSASTSSVNMLGTGTINSAGGTFYNLTTGAAAQVTTLTSDLTVTRVLTIADSTGTLTDNGVGYDITVTGSGTPFVNNGAAVTAKKFSYVNTSDATIIAAGGTYNVSQYLHFAGGNAGLGTTYQLNDDLVVNGDLHVYATSFGVTHLDTASHSITADSMRISNSAFQVGYLYAGNSTIDINGDVAFVNSVTTNVHLQNSDWYVSGNWANTSNVFTGGTSTVTFDGVNQQISGSTAFYNLTKVESTDDGIDSALIFDNAATQTINGTLTLTGLDADDRINLVSNVPGTQWGINLTASAAHALNYIVVTDSDASGSDPGQLTINPANSFSGGNNIGWFGATAGDDAYSVDEGSTTNLDLSANDNDADGLDLASIVITSGPTNGSITVNANGTVDYTHDDSETLSDSFTYTINDTLGEVSNIATVTLTVNPVNEAPVINDQAFSIDENRAMNFVVGTAVASDVDSGDTLTWSITGGTGATAFSILSTNGQIRVADPKPDRFRDQPELSRSISRLRMPAACSIPRPSRSTSTTSTNVRH